MSPPLVERGIRATITDVGHATIRRLRAAFVAPDSIPPGDGHPDASSPLRTRLIRDAILVATGGLLAVAAWEMVWLWRYVDAQRALGIDLSFYQEAARRWWEGGPLYLPDQLAGPYSSRTLMDFLYPPAVIYLFAIFVVVPSIIWWIVPLGLIVLVLARLRPASWTWPLLAAAIAYPKTLSAVLYGNSDLWVMAAVAGATLWAWPSVLVALKPSLVFLAPLGVRRRTWWIAGGVLVLISVPLGGLWVDYARAMLNLRDSWTRSLVDLPLVTLPLVVGPRAPRPSLAGARRAEPGSLGQGQALIRRRADAARTWAREWGFGTIAGSPPREYAAPALGLPPGGSFAGGRPPMAIPSRIPEAPTAHRTASTTRDEPQALDLDVVVLGGAGHVGLPLSLVFAERGLRVGIYDINQVTLEQIRRGQMPFLEHGSDALLKTILPTGRLEVSTDPGMLGRTLQIIVVVGTPIDEFLGPSMSVFGRAVDELAPHVRDGALVVLRSTVYPGTTQFVARALRERGRRIDVAVCPERIAEGHALEELRTLPQIIGADDPVAATRAEALFGRLVERTVHVSTVEAELAKLLTNTWRYMKFAVANQFLMISEEAGVDYTNVLRAIREDYPRAADLPGPGFAAGPCLFKDTMQLAAFTSDHFPLGQSAMQINEGLPAFIVRNLQRRHGDLAGRAVGILGMAFKAESDDTRASLSYKLRKLLDWAGARVLCTDPYVRDPRLLPLDEVLEQSEIVILGAPHRAYRGLQLEGRDVVDVWGWLGHGIRV